ncbi:putative inactive purple acid phosphatase 29 [Vitis vinifera]|uniref:Putative inactive purple acid phosphatase 29 n=1 Tax=Vitis vinifera TaxID=29760 RepID=A0A438HKU5_VITVI|nr:putative inactive purple acid phosphatase 29 [Vitis vinifera]
MAQPWKKKTCYWMKAMLLALWFSGIHVLADAAAAVSKEQNQLRFSKEGQFKILQVADMHFGDGKSTPCKNVLPNQMRGCSDLNTSAFIHRMIQAEKPHLIVFTGDNIYGKDAKDAVASLNAAFAPALSSNIPWAAVLGNHDQQSTLSREGVMKYIVGMKHSLSQLNPPGVNIIDGFGNYNLEVSGVEVLVYITNQFSISISWIAGITPRFPLSLAMAGSNPLSNFGFSALLRSFGHNSVHLPLPFLMQRAYMSNPEGQKSAAPGLAYFHIPLPECASFDSSNFTGVKQEGISSASVNSGFFTTMVEAGDVKAAFTGHDHLNDFCGELLGIHLCYAGGFGYHAYGKAGWARRARVVLATLEERRREGGEKLSLSRRGSGLMINTLLLSMLRSSGARPLLVSFYSSTFLVTLLHWSF